MTKHTIESGNKNFQGERFGLKFVNGKASTEDRELAQRIADHGYTVSGVKSESEGEYAPEIPSIHEVRVPLTDPDGVVRERTVAVLGGITGGSANGPDWTTTAEAEPTDPVAAKESRGEYGSDAEVIADKAAQELAKLKAATPDNVNPETAGGTDPVTGPMIDPEASVPPQQPVVQAPEGTVNTPPTGPEGAKAEGSKAKPKPQTAAEKAAAQKATADKAADDKAAADKAKTDGKATRA